MEGETSAMTKEGGEGGLWEEELGSSARFIKSEGLSYPDES